MKSPTATPPHRIDPDPLSPLNQMQRYLVHEFVEDYHDGLLGRRDLVVKIGYIVGGTAATMAVLQRFGISEASAHEAPAPLTSMQPQSPLSVPQDDPSVASTEIVFDSNGVQYTAYEARPANAGAGSPEAEASPIDAGQSGPALVLVCHENRGLTDHIRDVTRRLAREGYLGVAVDLLSPEGGTAAIQDPSSIPGLLTEGDLSRHIRAFSNAISYYQQQGDPAATRPAMIGFCFGGGITWRTATQEARLRAGVAFYGPPPPLEDVPNIKAAMLGIYSDDPGDFANDGRDDLDAALSEAGITHELRVYPNTQHAFHNDTSPRYNPEQAGIAWSDTLAWLAAHLQT